MKKKYVVISILSIFMLTTKFSMAEDAQPPIQGKNAGGEMQTTVVDENGNLKMIDNKNVSQTPPNIATPVPNISTPTPNINTMSPPVPNTAIGANATPPLSPNDATSNNNTAVAPITMPNNTMRNSPNTGSSNTNPATRPFNNPPQPQSVPPSGNTQPTARINQPTS